MAKTTMKKKTKRAKAEQKRIIKEEAAEVIRPDKEEKGVQQEPREEVEGVRELAAEMPQEEVAPEERPLVKGIILTQCMTNPSFRTQVIHHLVKKLR